MKFHLMLLMLLAALLLLQPPAEAQTTEAVRAEKWLTLHKLLFKKSIASWSVSAADLKQLKELTTMSPFANCTIAGTANCSGSGLPVTGLTLKGQRTNADVVLLKWETLAEYNSKGFILERQSFNNINVFDSIFYVDGAGTSYSKSKYQHTDLNNFRGISFYRVRQVDNDGHYTYSNVVQIDGGGGEFAVNVVPNPARSNSLRFYFTVPSLSQTIDFTIFNALGNSVVKKEKFVVTTGYYEMKNKAFPPGYYFITVHTGKAVYSKSFVITD